MLGTIACDTASKANVLEEEVMVLAHGGEIGTHEVVELLLLSLPVMVAVVFLAVRFGKGR